MTNLEIAFNQHDHTFCEASIYNGGPEYINSLTALFISFIGIFGLFKNKTDNSVAMLYYSLIVNGITSCLYHYTHYIGWGLMDRYSMIFIASYCYNIFINMLYIQHTFSSHIFKLSITTYLIYLSTVAGLHDEISFNNLFALFLISILYFIVRIRRVYFEIPPKIFIWCWKGISLITLAGASWIITETLCDRYIIMKYLMGHSIWHIGVALGGYFISIIPLYMNYDKILERPHILYWFKIPYIS